MLAAVAAVCQLAISYLLVCGTCAIQVGMRWYKILTNNAPTIQLYHLAFYVGIVQNAVYRFPNASAAVHLFLIART